MKQLVSVTDLRFAWKGEQPFLRIDSFKMNQGERLFLQGKSGSGKSTLLSLISGILTPLSGEITLMGQSPGTMKPAQRDKLRGDHIGYIFQQFNLIPYLSVEENILAPLIFSPLKLQKAGGRGVSECRRLLSELRLDVPLNKRADSLSIGQQQRVAAARALLGSPELIIADEPTSSVDRETGGEFMRLLFEECERYGAALLFVSHDERWKPLFSRVESMEELNTANSVSGGQP